MVNYKAKTIAYVVSQKELAPDIYSLWIKTDSLNGIKPGQFYYFFPKDSAHILGRPISICEYDLNESKVRFVYQKKGHGTTELSLLEEGDSVSIMGPLGNGFPIEDTSHSVLIGGGMGIAPLLGVAKQLKSKAIAVLGYRDIPFMVEDYIDAGCKVLIASEHGISGIKGNVVDALKKEDIHSITAYSCGPMPMLKAVCEYGKEHEIDTYVSLEERMGCGIGACLGCVTPSVKANDHYMVKKLCICKDGPVFHSTEVIL